VIDHEEIAALAAHRADTLARPTYFGKREVVDGSGYLGEVVFARLFGLRFSIAEHTYQVGGDGGIDFRVPIIGRAKPLTIDVKTATHEPWTLYVKESSMYARPDIYVSMAAINAKQAVFNGWARFEDVADAPKKSYYGPGSECRRIFQRDLRTLQTLCNIFALREDLDVVRPA
jgi:hypothetical protein